MNTKVSVVVPSYNSAHYLGEALDSILAQTYENYEIFVVNDGSTDATEALVHSYQKIYPGKITYIYQENRGLAAARNTAIRHCTGEYIALLDADDRWLPNRLSETVQAMDADGETGLVHANITRFTSTAILDTPDRDKRYLSGMIFKSIFLRRSHLSCPTILMRRRCLETVGLFDENLSYLGCEDRELWLRISQKYPISYIDKVLAFYRVSPNSMSSHKERMMKARLYVIDKFCPADSKEFRKKLLRYQALSKIYRDAGDEFLSLGLYPKARKAYAQAIFWYPVTIWPWINYFKTYRLGRN